MRYINRKDKQLIIDTPIHKSTTKTTTKDGKIKENIKYIAHIPNELLIFLLEQYKPFDFTADSAIEYIDATLKDGKKYLSFYDHPGKEYVEMNVTNDKFAIDNSASVTIKKQVTSNSYFFTISKRVFPELKDDNNLIKTFRFVIGLDSDSYYFKNCIIDTKLI